MLASFFSFYVDTSAAQIGQELSPTASRTLAIELEDTQQRLDDDQLIDLVRTEIPQLSLDDIERIADDSWTRANRRALETAFVVAVLTLVASTFIRKRRTS